MDEDAVSSTVAFLFAGILFLAGIGAVLTSTQDIASDASITGHDSQVLQQQAEAIRDLLLASPGIATAADGQDVDWADDADALDRFGLRTSGGAFLDFAKLTNLRSAPYEANSSDGYVNYEEARDSLGLDGGFDFHIRAYPALRSVQELLETGIQDRNLKVTYIGDATSGAEQQVVDTGTTPPLTTPVCGLSPLDSRSLRIEVDVTNNGQATTQFHIDFSVAFGNDVFRDVQRGATTAVSAAATIHVDVPGVEGDCDAIDSITATLVDPGASLSETTWNPGAAAVGVQAAQVWFTVDPDYESYRPADDVVITYAGDLLAKKGNTAGESLTLQVLDGATDVTPSSIATTLTVPKKNDPWEFDPFPASELGGVGTYTVVLTRANGEAVSDLIEVTASAPGNYLPPDGSASPPSDHTYASWAQQEIEFLESLVARFCPYVWDSQSETPIGVTWSPASWTGRCNSDYPPHSAAKGALGHFGDVFPDDKQLLGAELHERLAPGGTPSLDIVNTLVVGSNVDHNTMTSNAVKGAIRDWVTIAGGNLIVFGSEKQVVNWLNPIFKTKLDSSSNGISTPDADHPVLRVADDLSWDEYDDRGRAWELKQNDGTADSFTKVVHDNSADANAILAISDPGAYGSGTVILTSWLPYDLFNDGSQREGLVFMNNLLMQGYRDLFIDYGPSIPDGVQVLPAPGVAQVYHPELERHITLNVLIYVFPT